MTICGADEGVASSRYGAAHGLPTNRWGVPRIGLRGGGETANGWGAPPAQTQAWPASQAPQTTPQGQWGSRAPAPNTSPPQNSLKPGASTGSTGGPAPSGQPPSPAPTAAPAGPAGQGGWGGKDGGKRHLELQSIREALLSSEGWGGENVNQETSWECPASPEPGKDQPHKTLVNNGTDLWENNLRNGGAAPPKPHQAPWGHTPATNYGGTWGEDDDATQDSSNVWNGVPSQNQPWPAWPQGHQPKPKEWPGQQAQGGPGWDPQRGPDNPPGDWPNPHKPVGPHGPHAQPNSYGQQGNNQPNMGQGHHMGPHPGHQGHQGPLNGPHTPGAPHQGPPHSGPHGVPHNLPHQAGPHGGLGHGGPPQWGSGPKELKGGAGTGWEEPSPPSQRRDDGTAVWGNPQQQQGNVSRWKDMPNPNMMGPRGGPPQARMQHPPPHAPPGMKPDHRVGQPMWPHNR